MMMKFVTASLIAAMLLSLVSCNGGEGKGDVTEKITETVAETTETVTTVPEETTVETTVATEIITEVTTEVTTVATTEATTTTAPPPPPVPVVRPSDYPALSYTREELEGLDNTKHGWGQGVHVDALNRPTSCTSWQNTYGQYGGVYIMPETDGARLTFDLGYEFGCTGRILDTLKAKGVKGTFFITMYYAKSCPDLVQRMVDEGHIVGNHSVNHPSMPGLSVADMEYEIMELHNYVMDNFGYEMYLFRPPMGEHSVRSLAVAQNLGYKSVLWSFAYMDWDTAAQMPTDQAYDICTAKAHKGAVYLLHGISETNTAILGDLVDYLQSSGIGIENAW